MKSAYDIEMREREPLMDIFSNIEGADENILLKSPELISPEEIKLGDKQSSFSRDRDNGMISKYIIGTRNEQPFFVVEYYGCLPDDLTPNEKAQFAKERRQIGGVETDVYVLGYGNVPEMSAKEKETGTQIPDDYYVAKPRRLADYELGEGQLLTAPDLAEYVKTHKVVFYTGAGISINAGVPDMASWQEAMGIDLKQDMDDFLRRAVNDPEANLSSLQQFRHAAVELPPTPAHEAVKILAQKTGSQIMTENTDLLHERSGVRALHISGEWLRENVQEEWLKEIDGVVAVGLNADDRGFLAWYKQQNPNGKIIAVNVRQPNYVGEGDAIIEGDAQEILPEAAKHVIQ